MKTELINDHYQNFKRYGLHKAQLIIADVPYNIGVNAYGSNPAWYKGGDKSQTTLSAKELDWLLHKLNEIKIVMGEIDIASKVWTKLSDKHKEIINAQHEIKIS